MLPKEFIQRILASPFVERMSWLKGLGGDHHDTASASRYLGLPVLARPKVSVLLDRDFYLDQYPDVRDSGADPLIHFITSGCAEGRSPNPLVDISHIRRQDASLLPSLPSVRDLYEVLHYGLVDPGPYFSLDYYREQVASRSLEAAGLLEHFLTTGLRLGIRPNPFFDPLWYYRQLDGMHDVWSGLRHFVMSGDREGLAPSPEFSGKRYFERYPDVANAGIPALFHFLTAGRPEGRSPYAERDSEPPRVAFFERQEAAEAKMDEVETAKAYFAFQAKVEDRRQNEKDQVKPTPPPILRLQDPLTEIDKLAFPAFERPLVSILIPVFNEFSYTVECVASILAAKIRVSYEVVIADDASTDSSIRKFATVKNVKYIRQPANVGFLRNCNAAFAACAGKFILLLNNDAQLMPGAVDALVDMLAQDDGIAAVGPKMLYPDGRLQEAGCTINRDGVTAMVGLFGDPDAPAFNYSRDVHYCSGACLMIRRDEPGDTLFDEAFMPAYCEDVDLCLRLLAKGRRVVYCPRAVIVHHLSVSTNKQSVARRLQLVARNQDRLLHKWADMLQALNQVRPIAFYLPQFHSTEENDFNWGKGFTEWSNVAKARPAYAGHYQPHLPTDLGFYDLRVKQTAENQVSLARRYGVAGFCVYYYNFGGRRALDQAFEAIVADRSIDFPYCVCWANENWTRHWDGGTKEPIFTQKYDDEALMEVIHDATRFASDPRYIRVNGSPLFLVYRPLLIPDIQQFSLKCRREFRRSGHNNVHLVYVESMETIQRMPTPGELGFDACVEFPPQGVAVSATERPVAIRDDFLGLLYDYEATVINSISRATVPYKRYPAVFPSWDNTPRQPVRGDSFVYSSPEAFQVYLEEKLDETTRMFVGDERLLFVNAWNEWAEGTHLEPDQKYGHRWLEALHNALMTKSLA